MPADPLDPDGIDVAARFIEAMGCTIAYAGWVKKINDNKGISKRILFVTDAFITYVKNPKSPSLSHSFCWSTLFKINVADNRIELIFKNVEKFNQFRFISQENQIILRKIFDILLHMMTPNELAPLDLNRFPHPRISINPRGVLARFDQHLIRFGLNPHEVKFRSIFKHYLQSLKPDFFLEPFEHLFPVMKQVLYALIGSPNTKAFFFPEIKEKVQVYSLYRFIGYFAKLPTHVRFIQFQSPIISKISKIISSFSEKTSSEINGIGYSNVEMSEKDVERMKILIVAKPFVSLRWCNINPVTSIEDIYSEPKVQECLHYLALDNSKEINFDSLAPQLYNLSILSLERCDLDIVDVFEIIDLNNLTSLKMLNLSFNVARRPFNSSINIPSSLHRIDISHVRFSNNVMANVIEVLITNKYENGIKFYCDRYYIADEKEAQVTLDNFAQIETSNLIEFSWRKNKVSRSLIDFLSRSPDLIKLIFEDNIFNDGEHNLIEELISIFPRLSNLTHLFLCGGKKAKLGSDFNENFLFGLEELPNLIYLDISNNGISDNGIDLISQTLSDLPLLSHITFDGSNITSFEPIKRLANSAIENHRKFYISYPEEDIEALSKSEKITDDDINELVEYLKNASSSNKGSPINHIKRKQTDLNAERNFDSFDSLNSSHISRRRRRATESLYVNEGHAQNIKKNLLSEYNYQQDPDSIFIQPFDRWSGSINDNAFPLYLTEELEKELTMTREFNKPTVKITEHRSHNQYDYNETPKKKLAISPAASTVSFDFFDDFAFGDSLPASPISRGVNDIFKSSSDEKIDEENMKIEEEETEVNDISEKESEIPLQENPELLIEEEKYEEEIHETEEDKYEEDKHEEEKHEEEINKTEEEKQQQEEKLEVEEKHEEEKHEEEKHEEEINKTEEEKQQQEEKPEVEEKEIDIIKRSVDNYQMVIAPNSNSESYTEPEDIIEAVPFQPPTWYFPIPRPIRPSNKRFVKEMSEMLSTKTIINALKNRK
ncbi:hypothetical protein M9Y10_046103 [Tritrichomonas musculus]|uniref:Leucine Rich Repeat family protein n=1 Tax=Tritrichomonas musculus TaxID=1915356 RepID=A0ABR2GJ78_9EUKA